MLVSGWNCTSLVNLHCMDERFCLTGPAARVLAKLGAYLLPWISLPSSQGLTQLLTIPGAASQDTLSFGSFSYTSASLPQEMSLDSETCPGCTCIWSLPGHERCLKGIISRWGQLLGLHSQTPLPTTLRLGPKLAYFPSSWSSQFRAISVQFLFLLYSFLFPLLLPSALHSCSLRPLQWPPHHSRPRLPNHPISFCLFNLSKTQV